ncbi:MAG: hypothetical protein BZY88_03285 [SAR202 cluster bacterium Io17-Chloro-G9]|nr:MAG: hypothetical protein BZY88_03285 [SAR202 cluster bacterium Io17-Chloro-G9]
MATTYRAEHIGSFLSPAEVLQARVDHTQGHLSLKRLRFMPKDKTVVLGLMSFKQPALESQDVLRRRIDEAAQYIPMENLAISPQWGFALPAPGNLLTMDQQARKLELVVETARKVWG